MRGNWQDYCQDASRGHSAIAELLVLSALVHSGAKTQLFQAICRTAKVRAFLGRIEVRYFESATKLRAIESVYFLRTIGPISCRRWTRATCGLTCILLRQVDGQCDKPAADRRKYCQLSSTDDGPVCRSNPLPLYVATIYVPWRIFLSPEFCGQSSTETSEFPCNIR